MQTGFKRIYTPHCTTNFIGGICRWWYVPVHAIASFPRIDPVSQRYESEPTLLPGYQWLGPIKVPDSKLGFTESQEPSKPGGWMKQSIAAYTPGDTPANRILRQNMMKGEYVAVARMRSGEFYILIGTDQSGLSYDHTFKTGNGGNKSDAGADWTLATESPCNAPELAAFSQDTSAGSGLPNKIFYGYIDSNRLPTTLEIETAASATFTNGANIAADFTGDTVPRWRFVAELFSEPEKHSYYANLLATGSIGLPGSFDAWIKKGFVARTGGLQHRVYLSGFPSIYSQDILEFRI